VGVDAGGDDGGAEVAALVEGAGALDDTVAPAAGAEWRALEWAAVECLAFFFAGAWVAGALTTFADRLALARCDADVVGAEVGAIVESVPVGC
jgi:hypothetical protein